MEFEKNTLPMLERALARLASGFGELPPVQRHDDVARIEDVLMQVADAMRDNYPYFHPLYAGQMLKPPHPMARVAYMLAMWINPNNHALDGGRASSRMEKEAVAEIAAMFGWDRHLGHLTGGGTMANMEALWIAGRLHPGKKVVASEMAHYTHSRLTDVLGIRYEAIPADADGRMNVEALARVLEDGEVGTVVATMGTTGAGAVDPLPEILGLRGLHGFRVHADSAYGGYFHLADNLAPPARRAFDRIGEVDSIVVDPHKHGLQPYGCGCVLYQDPEVGRHYKHESPYTYFTSKELHLGEISLECSRAGASAVALWATQRLMPLVRGGTFARGLADSREAALRLHQRLSADRRFRMLFPPELDIVVWAPAGDSASQISERSERLFEAAARENLHLATYRYPSALLRERWPQVHFDRADVVCMRSCLMKAEHKDWLDQIWSALDRAATPILGRA